MNCPVGQPCLPDNCDMEPRVLSCLCAYSPAQVSSPGSQHQLYSCSLPPAAFRAEFWHGVQLPDGPSCTRQHLSCQIPSLHVTQ